MTLTEAVLVPVEEGVKVTVIKQLPPTATLVPQVFVCAKSAAFVPVIVMLVMTSIAEPVFCRVVLSGALVTPVAVEGKVRDAGLKLTAAAVPTPLTGTL